MRKITRLTPIKILRVLFYLRFIAVVCQIIVITLATEVLAFDLPLVPMYSVVAIQTAWNLAVYSRLRKNWVVTPVEIFLNLMIDSIVLTFQLFWAGGATNPFVFVYLIPIAFAAAAMPLRYAWATSLLNGALYSCLMFVYIPLPPVHGRFGGDFNLHVFGMWVNFILSAVLMTLFVAGIASAVRQRDQSLAQAREEALKSEKIVAMGTLAAGVAHEISTPLTTMTVLVDELKQHKHQDAAVDEDLTLLKRQIDLCKEKLRELLDSSGHTRSEGGQALPLREFVERLLDQWQVMRPEIELTTIYHESFCNPMILSEQTIAQSVINLLNNAADASVENGNKAVVIRLSSSDEQLLIYIDDEGKGVTQEQMEQAGEVSFTTKKTGFGIGLVLSNASLGRFGGEVLLNNRAQGGTRTEVRLPLKELRI